MNDELPDDLDWGDQLARGTTYAERRARRLGVRLDGEEAQGVASEALTQILDAGWDRKRYPTFAELLGSRINGLIQNRSRKKGTREEVKAQPLVSSAADPARSPEQVVAERELASRATTLMLERLDGNAVASKVFIAMAEGGDGASDIAAMTELPVEAVYRARERISELSAHVAAELTKELDA
ncbi:MAG: hypothetical protein U0234_17955 [Sandaracinus sp.]